MVSLFVCVVFVLCVGVVFIGWFACIQNKSNGKSYLNKA